MARNGRKKGHFTVLFIFTQTIIYIKLCLKILNSHIGALSPDTYQPWLEIISILHQQKDWVGGFRKWQFLQMLSTVFMHSGWV
jgi:hypothetical protein